MKAVIIENPGSESWAVLGTLPDPAPGPGEVLIRVIAAGVNRADLSQRAGRYQPPPGASTILGLEVAGIVEAVGEGVDSPQPGERVFTLLAGGGYAELVVAPAKLVMQLPDQLSFVEGAAIVEVFYTALLNLRMIGGMREGQHVLIHAGASGVGMAAIQLCRLYGASAAVTVGTREKAESCLALGAERAILYREEDFQAVVKEWTDGRGVDLILDPVGASYLERNIASLATDGMLISIGLMGGQRAELDIGRMLMRRLTIKGSTLRALPLERKLEVRRRFLDDVLPALLDGRLRATIDRTFSCEEVELAHRYMAENRTRGKLVLMWDNE